MKIAHLCNSCIFIEDGETRLLCDPWIGTADGNAWLSFPYKDEAAALIKSLTPNCIYISHIHPDHFDPKTLCHIEHTTPVFIKKFKDGRLLGKIEALGFSSILELDPWTSHSVGDDIELVIVPSTSMVNQGIAGTIHYDMDTSLLVRSRDNGQVFYNNVDNPTSLTALKEVCAFSEKTWKRSVDVACLPVGAASEYPHCFVNIDRNETAKNVIEASLNGLPDRIAALGCHTFFAAGGTYVIRGKFSALNQYIGQPTPADIAVFLKHWANNGNSVWSLEGGHAISYNTKAEAWQSTASGVEKQLDKIAYAKDAATIDFDYRTDCRSGNVPVANALKRLHNALEGALDNYSAVLSRIGIVQNWTTVINLYQDLQVDLAGDISSISKPADMITLPCSGGEKSEQTLTFHMDIDLLTDLVEGQGNWNGALSGSYIIYEREPNIFLPDVPFSLNFLVNRN